MKVRKNNIIQIIACFTMLIVIIDSETAIRSATNAIELCVRTIIPSLFPLIFLATIIRNYSASGTSGAKRIISKIFRIPRHAESIVLLGILGGYPIGARCINDMYKSGQINKVDAERLLPICNNAGPAFIFGIVASLFETRAAGWTIWGIQILSAIFISYLLPNYHIRNNNISIQTLGNDRDPLSQALRGVATICGWVILFRILLQFLDRWIMYLMPMQCKLILSGFIELANGILLFNETSDPYIFIYVNCFLAFGGLCVFMQVKSSAPDLSLRLYWLGKILQTTISGFLSSLYLAVFEHIDIRASIIFLCLSAILSYLSKKTTKNNSGNKLLCSV